MRRRVPPNGATSSETAHRSCGCCFFHDTPAAETQRFRDQLSWLRDHFNVIDFPTFTRLCDGSTALQDGRPAALLTFDDGLVSNYEMAAPVLEEAGMRGLFFVVPHFSMRSGADARAFYVERIRNRPPGLTAMTPAQIRDLADRGHAIGNHTLTHARLSISPEGEYEAEILKSAEIVESWIGRKVEAFSWPLLWNAITPRAYRMIVERHPYCFTPCSAGWTCGSIPRRSCGAQASRRPMTCRNSASSAADLPTTYRRGGGAGSCSC